MWLIFPIPPNSAANRPPGPSARAIDSATRSASVVAETDLICYGLDRATFQMLLRDHPELAEHFAETLAAREAGLATARGEVEETRRRRRDTTKHDLLGKIRGLFGLGD